MEKIILSNQLAAKTSEARASEFKFKRLTEIAPVGIYMCDQIQYVYPEDREMLLNGLADITDAEEPVA
ncbi:hypothetical protein H072_5827 [Dactylellina haptotyla CBS 200.50]|uniref:Uncharacterized protein n=1 Tax=Dactylellina haptotyla (strain CBS 200.50) TaxID=1284197 RepID=S8BLT6_DACHA|nr:hypothetical protein H072_5827 [Dactylellina haptotyla CBS 200.50]